MGVLGVGVDVVHIPRIAALLQRRGARLASRILSPKEFSEWESLPLSDFSRQVRFLAVRWGIKEAAYKAMYPTVRPTWKELAYRGLNEGVKPALAYHPTAVANKSRIGPIHVSVSHDGEYVFASVTIETPL
ncbi:putative 4'-phosphopantetheinyl transferase [Lyophyllum shimeji]|uniref:4'-phosphopantetheinyl transferase n=1 Tax=Lyophyllum shimeji TaxID=47721 RepID=A0A9P3PDR7_LYOSH|nr:putative 4'-phosphopantetheinyl transferase [Lyophyllum shimeji]